MLTLELFADVTQDKPEVDKPEVDNFALIQLNVTIWTLLFRVNKLNLTQYQPPSI